MYIYIYIYTYVYIYILNKSYKYSRWIKTLFNLIKVLVVYNPNYSFFFPLGCARKIWCLI